MQRFVVGLVIALCVFGHAARTEASVWDAAADLSQSSVNAGLNPNGTWSYGSRGFAASTAFTPFTTNGVYTRWLPGTQNVMGWMGPSLAGDTLPYVLKNMGPTVTYGVASHVTLPAGAIVQHPASSGSSDAYSILRWTAPSSGSYLLDATFTGIDSVGTTSDVHVILDGVSLFGANISGGLGASTDTYTYSGIVNVLAGDSLDFAVGPGANGFSFDSTEVSAKITSAPIATPEPSSVIAWVGLAAMGVVVGWYQRRHGTV